MRSRIEGLGLDLPVENRNKVLAVNKCSNYKKAKCPGRYTATDVSKAFCESGSENGLIGHEMGRIKREERNHLRNGCGLGKFALSTSHSRTITACLLRDAKAIVSLALREEATSQTRSENLVGIFAVLFYSRTAFD